ncbi:H-NS histone family protein [Burkholderia cepacia]|uniref:H-NS histone family protein n=1 Tax=Burkholderia cepacia TaxID=292 RepID=UPI0009BD9B63|nr:H-NS histone family protein [Burkholderia cepacia]RQT71093.1 H-NS histone family protein [Burkholderia cepacia]RQT91819.1 H-NS histone family protein [Burkholderia cepacia]RQZ67871.1 H-NS histone family protein [Burkholderia cepacia]RQZ90182.1 H-NS histone family protein [Burkholderia cepacia]RQZ95535.1 H-NS histone family protein [Burkholderia cepacia]
MRTYIEITQIIRELQQELSLIRENEAQKITARVLDLLNESGVDVEKMLKFQRVGRRAGEKIQPKFWNPETGETWAGRGKTPKWLVGKDIEKFRIGKNIVMSELKGYHGGNSGENV